MTVLYQQDKKINNKILNLNTYIDNKIIENNNIINEINNKILLLNDNILQIEEYNHLLSSLNEIKNDIINDKILKLNNKVLEIEENIS
jgi:hypothetical protein